MSSPGVPRTEGSTAIRLTDTCLVSMDSPVLLSSSEPGPWLGAKYKWQCVLQRDDQTYTVIFWMGSALPNPPTPAEVLGCVIQDAQLYLRHSWPELASELGLGVEIYRALRQVSLDLVHLLGREVFWQIVPQFSQWPWE